MAPTSGSTDYALSLRPDYHQAIVDVIHHYQWKNIIYIYDSHDGKSDPSLISIHSFPDFSSVPNLGDREQSNSIVFFAVKLGSVWQPWTELRSVFNDYWLAYLLFSLNEFFFPFFHFLLELLAVSGSTEFFFSPLEVEGRNFVIDWSRTRWIIKVYCASDDWFYRHFPVAFVWWITARCSSNPFSAIISFLFFCGFWMRSYLVLPSFLHSRRVGAFAIDFFSSSSFFFFEWLWNGFSSNRFCSFFKYKKRTFFFFFAPSRFFCAAAGFTGLYVDLLSHSAPILSFFSSVR